MAISAPLYRLLKDLKPEFPRGGKLLEIGEANWYGDIDPLTIFEMFADEGDVDRIYHEEQLRGASMLGDGFIISKIFYRALFAPSVMHAVDLNGTSSALRQDLNRPLNLANTYDVVINNGTAEHIFNIGQVFKSVHDACKTGGLMIHDSPFTGWIDHGFYCLHPTLFYDLAAANGYEFRRFAIYDINAGSYCMIESREHIYKMAAAGSIPNNAMLFVAWRKTSGDGFKIPMQGYYGGALSPEGKKAWESLR